jgi:hypothetical protein
MKAKPPLISLRPELAAVTLELGVGWAAAGVLGKDIRVGAEVGLCTIQRPSSAEIYEEARQRFQIPGDLRRIPPRTLFARAEVAFLTRRPALMPAWVRQGGGARLAGVLLVSVSPVRQRQLIPSASQAVLEPLGPPPDIELDRTFEREDTDVVDALPVHLHEALELRHSLLTLGGRVFHQTTLTEDLASRSAEAFHRVAGLDQRAAIDHAAALLFAAGFKEGAP